MDGIRTAVRAGALVAMGGLVAITLLALPPLAPGPAPEPALPLYTKTGEPLAAPTEPGVTLAVWRDLPVLVFVAPTARLEGVEAARGLGEATPSVPVTGHADLRLFALSAKSTHLGCTVGFNAGLGASRDISDYDADGRLDGRIMDPCHQGQWDPYNRGKPVVGPTRDLRLPVLDVFVRDGVLYATGYDGEPGPPRLG